MIYLVSSFYNDVMYTNHFIRTSNSEKYVIFKDFKYDQTKDSKFLDSKISLFEEILKQLSSSDFSDKFLNDILPDMELPKDFVNVFVFLNTKIANKQQIMINHIVSYIKENNYYGEKYHNYKKVQIDETKKWSESYFPDEKEFSKTLKSFKTSKEKILDYNSKEIKLFVKDELNIKKIFHLYLHNLV